MLEKNELEKHLLSRCFSDSEKIEELLSTRYTFTGSQKPSLVLLPTTSDDNSKPKSLLHKEDEPSDKQSKQRKVNTRIEVRNYLASVKKNQGKIIKKIQEYNRYKSKRPNKKPFPIMKLITKYDIPDYDDFVPMNNLWNEYMQSLVFPGIKSPEDKIPNKQMILSKLATAEYNGGYVTVLDSRNPHLIGISGIVVYDTQYSLIVCVKRDESEDATPAKQIGGLRFIPKRYSLFSFDVLLPNTTDKPDQCLTFTLIGSRIEIRSVDRSTKKFKNHNVEDII